MGHEGSGEAELGRSDLDLLRAARERRVRIQAQARDLDRRVESLGGPFDADSADASQEILGGERLGQVVVGGWGDLCSHEERKVEVHVQADGERGAESDGAVSTLRQRQVRGAGYRLKRRPRG